MKLPRGRLVRSRVVDDPATALAGALDRSLTGYAVLEPQETLLFSEEDDRGVVTFEAGVPVVAYHTGTDRGGPAALGDLAMPGPYHADLYRLAGDALAPVHATDPLRVPPGMAADRLAGDPDLAERTRRRAATREAPAADAPGEDPVVTFLEDDDKIAAIQERARREAERRAEAWGLEDHLG